MSSLVSGKALKKVHNALKGHAYINKENYDIPTFCLPAQYLIDKKFQHAVFTIYPSYFGMFRKPKGLLRKFKCYIEKWENCSGINCFGEGPYQITITFTGKPVAHPESESKRRTYTFKDDENNFSPDLIFKRICKLINSFSHPDKFPISLNKGALSPYYSNVQKAMDYFFCTANKQKSDGIEKFVKYLKKYPLRVNFVEFGAEVAVLFPILIKAINAPRTVNTIRVDFLQKNIENNTKYLSRFLSAPNSVDHLIVGGKLHHEFPIDLLLGPKLTKLTFYKINIEPESLHSIFKAIKKMPNLTKLRLIRSLDFESFNSLWAELQTKPNIAVRVDHIRGKKRPSSQQIAQVMSASDDFEISNAHLTAADVSYIIDNTTTKRMTFGGLDFCKNDYSVSFNRQIEKISFPKCTWNANSLISCFRSFCNYNKNDISVDISGLMIDNSELIKFFNMLDVEQLSSDYLAELYVDDLYDISYSFIYFMLRCRNLRVVSLKFAPFKDKIGLGIIDLIDNLPLKSIDITGNQLGDGAMQEICAYIINSRTLTSINLSGHRCKDYGPFIEVLTKNRRILHADVTSEFIDPIKTEEFARRIAHNRGCSLDLSWPFAASVKDGWNPSPSLLEKWLSLKDLSKKTGVMCETAEYPPAARTPVVLDLKKTFCAMPPSDLIIKFTKIDDDNPYADIDATTICSGIKDKDFSLSGYHWEDEPIKDVAADEEVFFDNDEDTKSEVTLPGGLPEIARVCGVEDCLDGSMLIAMPPIKNFELDINDMLESEFSLGEITR